MRRITNGRSGDANNLVTPVSEGQCERREDQPSKSTGCGTGKAPTTTD